MTRLVGIDLGTTNSVVAYMDGPEPKVVLNRDSQMLTPSVVSVHRRRRGKPDTASEILVGEVARDNFAVSPRDTIYSIKRLMGRGVDDPEVESVREHASFDIVAPRDGTRDSVRVVLDGVERSPADISALILRRLVDDATFRIGEPVTHAVITVPAYFSQAQRAATRDAGLKAGISVIQLIDEPTAAALAFSLGSGGFDEARKIVVYDLGGGTFDVAVGMMSGDAFVPLDVEGNMWLGGDDFDALLSDWAVERLREQHGVALAPTLDNTVALRAAARRAKERLSSSESADFRLFTFGLRDAADDLLDADLEITRGEVDELIAPRVRATIELTETALCNAGVTAEEIDHVVMVGNSTALRYVQRSVEQLFGPGKVLYGMHPKHCVAIGAALVAAKVGPRVVCPGPGSAGPATSCGHVNATDAAACEQCGTSLLGAAETAAPPDEAPMTIAPFHYGIVSSDDTFNLFVEKGSLCPTPIEDRHTKAFRTASAGQRIVSMPVYGGMDLARASGNEKQSELLAILPANVAEGTEVRVTLWLDESQIFRLEASLESGRKLKPFALAKGEPLAKIVGDLEGVQRRWAEVAPALAPQRRRDVEDAHEAVLGALAEADARQAQMRLRQFADLIEPRRDVSDEELSSRELLTASIQYGLLVSHECSPALDARELAVLDASIRDAERALARGAHDAHVELERLADALDALPPIADTILDTRLAIASAVEPADLAVAEDLTRELHGITSRYKTDPPGASRDLTALRGRIDEKVTQMRPDGVLCELGHLVPPGRRHCPVCEADTYILRAVGTRMLAKR